jgi:hypothetical protein
LRWDLSVSFGWASSHDALISASWVAGITGRYHLAWLIFFSFLTFLKFVKDEQLFSPHSVSQSPKGLGENDERKSLRMVSKSWGRVPLTWVGSRWEEVK